MEFFEPDMLHAANEDIHASYATKYVMKKLPVKPKLSVVLICYWSFIALLALEFQWP
jgi:hypothetical protein